MRELKEEHIGRQVEVYFNLHKHCWSVRDKKTRRVIGHTWNVQLANCTFKVSQAGREKKNVHAYVVGTLVGWDAHIDVHTLTPYPRQAYYNPYFEQFVWAGSQVPALQADKIYMNSHRQVIAY